MPEPQRANNAQNNNGGGKDTTTFFWEMRSVCVCACSIGTIAIQLSSTQYPSMHILVWTAFAFTCHVCSLAYSDAFGRPDAIVDIGFKALPDVRAWPPWLVDVIPYSLLLVTFVVVLLRGARLTPIVSDLTTIMVVRAVANWSTLLPPSDPSCSVTGDPLYWVHGGCYDKIFSGHLAYATYLTAILWEPTLFVDSRLVPVAMALTAIETVLLVATRAHYTVDCVLAIIVGLYQARVM